jgi:hypothetical protein
MLKYVVLLSLTCILLTNLAPALRELGLALDKLANLLDKLKDLLEEILKILSKIAREKRKKILRFFDWSNCEITKITETKNPLIRAFYMLYRLNFTKLFLKLISVLVLRAVCSYFR